MAPMGRNATQLHHKSTVGTGNLDGNFNEGPEIENLINKNIYPADKQDLKVEDDKGSALSAMGLKPKIVH